MIGSDLFIESELKHMRTNNKTDVAARMRLTLLNVSERD